MKIVTFEIAKAIKEAGYPQECGLWYSQDGREFSYTEDYSDCYARPTYLEVWLWLWREKKIAIGCPYIDTYDYWFANMNAENDKSLKFWEYSSEECNDPEEAIINAIKYLVDNNLIK